MTTITINPVKNSNIEIPFETNLQVIDHDQPIPKDCHSFEVLTVKDGGKRLVWNKYSLSEIREAKKNFDKLVAEGLVPYWVNAQTGKESADVMQEFDARAEEVIFLPIQQVQGG